MNSVYYRLPPPASKEAVKNLPDVTIDSENKNCPICLKTFRIGEKVKEMPCKHVFHSVCILTWLEKVNYIHSVTSIKFYEVKIDIGISF